MPRTSALPPMNRPGTDELVARYRLIRISRRHLLELADVATPSPCSQVDPEAFHMQASPIGDQPNRAERKALAICAGCPVLDLCLVRDMRETKTPFELRGVRAGLRQSERRALHLALGRAGEL
ncbi:WhiB family transcriptional regulator [Streptomyces sp. NPDC023588]|uniref:WhiB family transcriptional regulator n=1 Tax=Streptomyces sp. NPDC023588 TaxID=3154907 RepID=UPI003408D68E